MKFQKRLNKFSKSSYFLIVPKSITDTLKLEKDMMLDIEISTLKDKNVVSKYICKSCKKDFISDDNFPICPNCDNKNLFIIQGEK